MKKRTCTGILSALVLALCLFAQPAFAADYQHLPGQEVRVLLTGSSSASQYSVTVSSGTYSIVAENDPDSVLVQVSDGAEIVFTSSGPGSYGYTAGGVSGSSSSPLLAVPDDSEDTFTYNGNPYRGCFKAIHSGTYFYAVNQINIELYLYGVVGRELGYGYSMDSTMAQAVAARSYALANYSAFNKYYDLTATTSSQVYGGKKAESDKIIQAVDDSCGYVLRYNNKCIQTYYSSNMGGYTENIENVWMSDEIPIRGVPSPHDALAGNYSSYGASTYSWTVEYTPAELVSMANRYGDTDIGEYTGISYSDTLNGVTSVSGRAMTVTIHGTKDSVTATKDNIRSLLNLKSTLITITDNTSVKVSAYVMGADGKAVALSSLEDLYAVGGGGGIMKANGSESKIYAADRSGSVELNKKPGLGNTIVIQGRGYGHGVGLSQFGAIAMGDDGYSWDEIIEHYFCNDTGILLEQIY